MEEFVTKSLLFDFYGELLTEHQKKIYQEIVFEDYSLSEVAREEGVTRQGIHDLMKRCERMLEEYETKLHLVEKFLNIRRDIAELRRLASPGSDLSPDEMRESMRHIDRAAAAILEEL